MELSDDAKFATKSVVIVVILMRNGKLNEIVSLFWNQKKVFVRCDLIKVTIENFKLGISSVSYS
jgi:hypothetical protein